MAHGALGTADQKDPARPTSVAILDTTLRDGLQIEKEIPSTAAKVEIASLLMDAGLKQLEIGAFVHPKKVPQMADTDALFDQLGPLAEARGVDLYGLVFNRRGAERAVAAGARRVKLVVSVSEGHSQSNADSTVAQATERILDSVAVLTSGGVSFDISTAVSFICPFDGITDADRLVEVLRPFVDAGAEGIGLADTIGNANPSLVARNTRAVQRSYPGHPINLHLHDTFNFGMANVLAALDLGIDRFDATVGGLGGCPFAPGAAGNIGTDDLVHLLHREGVETGVDGELLSRVREPLIAAVAHSLTSSLSEIPAPPAAFTPEAVAIASQGGRA
ncbi:hydroxymethylglutaryl-CoA lyase [Brevibacterium sp. Mu109]|nr:hydroxymethylglutaryl-CoA lyase [Brevibacterium sp. Mu109]